MLPCPSRRSGQMRLRAPTDPGNYELGYYSYIEQGFMLHGPAIQVHPFTIRLQTPSMTPVNAPLTVTWEADAGASVLEDRYRIYTDEVCYWHLGVQARCHMRAGGAGDQWDGQGSRKRYEKE